MQLNSSSSDQVVIEMTSASAPVAPTTRYILVSVHSDIEVSRMAPTSTSPVPHRTEAIPMAEVGAFIGLVAREVALALIHFSFWAYLWAIDYDGWLWAIFAAWSLVYHLFIWHKYGPVMNLLQVQSPIQKRRARTAVQPSTRPATAATTSNSSQNVQESTGAAVGPAVVSSSINTEADATAENTPLLQHDELETDAGIENVSLNVIPAEQREMVSVAQDEETLHLEPRGVVELEAFVTGKSDEEMAASKSVTENIETLFDLDENKTGTVKGDFNVAPSLSPEGSPSVLSLTQQEDSTEAIRVSLSTSTAEEADSLLYLTSTKRIPYW